MSLAGTWFCSWLSTQFPGQFLANIGLNRCLQGEPRSFGWGVDGEVWVVVHPLREQYGRCSGTGAAGARPS